MCWGTYANKPPVSITHPHLMEEWSFEKNGNIRPEALTYGVSTKVWWKCNENHLWEASLNERTSRNKGCPYCSGRRVSDKNRLSVLFVELIKEWDFDKNQQLRPESFSYGSKKKVWWKCKNCDYSWKTAIEKRTRENNPTGCPACANKVATETNNMEVRFPEIAKEWHPTKNNKLKPTSFTAFSRKIVWWLCSKEKCGCEWRSTIANRTFLNNGCPCCIGRIRTKNNNLIARFPEVAKEWDYDRNSILDINSIAPVSRQKVWWVCGVCGHNWRTCIGDRTGKGSGCPRCSKRPISDVSQRWLDNLSILPEYREYFIKELGFRVDGFNPKTNTVYEFFGDFWHGNPEVFSPEEVNPVSKKTYGQLYKETMERIDLLKENGYKVVYIWESDFNNEQC